MLPASPWQHTARGIAKRRAPELRTWRQLEVQLAPGFDPPVVRVELLGKLTIVSPVYKTGLTGGRGGPHTCRIAQPF
jgi:hypothetical protein